MSNSLTSMLSNIKAEFMVKRCCLFFKCGVFLAKEFFCCLCCKCTVFVVVANVVLFLLCFFGKIWCFFFKENYYENVYTLNAFSLAKTVFDAGLNI